MLSGFEAADIYAGILYMEYKNDIVHLVVSKFYFCYVTFRGEVVKNCILIVLEGFLSHNWIEICKLMHTPFQLSLDSFLWENY